MQHKVKVTVIDKKVYPDIQREYCADPESGPCPCYHVGDEYIFERYGEADSFWQIGLGSLVKTSAPEGAMIAGGKERPHCSEAWDAISRYIYTGLQGGSIMRGWMKDENVMIACCNDGTRPVIFKIERLDFKAVYTEEPVAKDGEDKLKQALLALPGVTGVSCRENWVEVLVQGEVEDAAIRGAAEATGVKVNRID